MPSEFSSLISRSPVTINVAGAEVTIPYASAAVWIEAMERPAYLAFTLADEPSRERLIGVLMDVPGSAEALERQSHALIRSATGRARWWEGVRLANTAASADVLGHLVLAGVDPHARTIGEWCSAMYTVATKDADETGQIRFEMQLAFPPSGYEDQWDDGVDYDEMVAGFRDLPGVN